MGRLKNLCKFINFSSIFFFFCNTSFWPVLWFVSSSKLLPDNVEQYLTHWHESFNFGDKNTQKCDRWTTWLIHFYSCFLGGKLICVGQIIWWYIACKCDVYWVSHLLSVYPPDNNVTIHILDHKIICDTCNLNEYTGALMNALVCRRQSIALERLCIYNHSVYRALVWKLF